MNSLYNTKLALTLADLFNRSFSKPIAISDAIMDLTYNLQEIGTIQTILIANTLLDYNSKKKSFNSFYSPKILHIKSPLEKKTKELFSILGKSYSITCDSRLKSLISFLKKILLYISANKPICTPPDTLGARFIVYDQDEATEISSCYKIAKEILYFFLIQTNAQLIETSPARNVSNSILDGIILPTKEDFAHLEHLGLYNNNLIKDYIAFPKKNGYQNMQFTISIPSIQITIEIQIRGSTMHTRAETAPKTAHKEYKKNKYDIDLINLFLENIDINNINVIDFSNDKDSIGLFDAMYFNEFCNLN